jgi:hypothetical protein
MLSEIERLEVLAVGLQQQQDGPALKALKDLNQQAEQTLSMTVKSAPSSLAKLTASTISNVAGELAKKGAPDSAFLRSVSSDLSKVDPQNAKEVQQAFTKVNLALKKSPLLDRAGNQALRVLREAGILGDTVLADTLEWLVVASGLVAMGAQIKDQVDAYQSKKRVAKVSVQAGPLSLSVNELGDFNGSLMMLKPKWLGSSLAVSVSGKRGRVTDVSVAVPVSIPVGRWGGVQIVTRPSVEANRKEGVTLGGQLSVQVPTHQGMVRVSPYASAGIQSGSREGGVKVVARFGEWSDGSVPGSSPLKGAPVASAVAGMGLVLLGISGQIG